MGKVLSVIIGAAGSISSVLFGEWSETLTTLLIFMAVDCFIGLVVAVVFKNSPETDSSAFEIHAGIKCIFRKVGMLALLIIAYRVDFLLGIGGCVTRNGVAIALCINESASIIGNLGRMGLKIPAPLSRTINLLKNTAKDKSEGESNNDA